MDIVQRLILAVLLLSGVVHAETMPAVVEYQVQNYGWHTTKEAACATAIGQSFGGGTLVNAVLNSGSCAVTYSFGGGAVISIAEHSVCPSSGGWSVLTGTSPLMCSRPDCPSGQVRQPGGSCSVPPNCQLGRVLLSGPFSDDDGDGRLMPLACISGCYAHLTNSGPPEMDCSMGGGGTIGICTYVLPGDYIDQGESCSPDEKPVKQPPDERGPCPECDCMKAGKSWGQVNGVDVCLPRGAPGTKPVQTKPAPTIKEEKPKPTPENPNPEATRTVTPAPIVTVTPNPKGGEPTVKEETTNPDGSTTTKEMGMGKYCEEKPNSQTCKSTGNGAGGTGGGGFEGSCESGFICTGDGVQCAIARKIHQDRCDDLKGMEPFADVAEQGRKILTGENDQAVDDFLNRDGESNRTVNVGNLVSEDGNYQFAASCISDVQFSIGGHSITVPISRVCPYFEMIGYFLLAAAYLAALRIVEVI